MTSSRIFWAGGRVLAMDSGPLEVNRAYLCPTCGEVWGRIYLADPSTNRWVAFHTPCEKHPISWLWPAGCFWSDLNRDFTDTFPPEVLLREFHLHLTHHANYPYQP